MNKNGPLAGYRVVEMDCPGPVHFCGMLFAQAGADVIRVAREPRLEHDALLDAGRVTVVLDLKTASDLDAARSLLLEADVLLEGFRPGVMEGFDLGPKDCLRANPRLVYGRMTGWGQGGAWGGVAGHDINYLAGIGALHLITDGGHAPMPPLNMLADYGGGSMFVMFGVLSALLAREASGKGQVVDAAMADGVNMLMSYFWGKELAGKWKAPGRNEIDGGAPYYNVYATSDARWMAVGAIEDKFFESLVSALGLNRTELPDRRDRANWTQLKQILASRFAMESMDTWVEVFAQHDACVTPVLTPQEVRQRAAADSRQLFEPSATGRPIPAPRLSETPLTWPRERPKTT